jgi:release factor glutamine methyltransferase
MTSIQGVNGARTSRGLVKAEELIAAGQKRLLREVDRFSRYGDERLQARELLEHAARGDVYDDDEIDVRTRRRYEGLLERRAKGEPIGYIRGYEEFRGIRLTVRPGAFIPRESTQFLAEQAIRRLRGRKRPVAADIATGIGAVALAIARDVPGATAYGTDISPVALSLARANARRHRLPNVRFLTGSGFEPLPRKLRGSLDVIVSHPPYVPTSEVGELPVELLDFEPVESLTDSSDDGLGFVRMLVRYSRDWLKPDGWLCLEVGPDLARTVRSMLVRAGYRSVRSTHGVSPYTRVLVAKR